MLAMTSLPVSKIIHGVEAVLLGVQLAWWVYIYSFLSCHLSSLKLGGLKCMDKPLVCRHGGQENTSMSFSEVGFLHIWKSSIACSVSCVWRFLGCVDIVGKCEEGKRKKKPSSLSSGKTISFKLRSVVLQQRNEQIPLLGFHGKTQIGHGNDSVGYVRYTWEQ